ncbi:MAG: MFS transporter [Oceanipulchritudo sp.]
MIVTAKNKIPLLWQFAIAAPWGALRFKFMIMGAVFVFSLKKFIENPAEITFLMSIPGIVTIAIAPIASFMSDRIWTRWGRRKIFTIPSIIGIVVAFIAMPLMPNIWGLLIAYIFYEFCNDFGMATYEVLKQEVVPPKQRGTAAAIGTWLQNAANLVFYLVAIGRFDDYQYYAGFPVSGEQSLYWGVALIIFMMSLIIVLGVRETYQPSKLRGQRFSLGNFFGSLLNRNLWPVYLLVVGWIVSNASLGSLSALLYTEQWGFTKQEMGTVIAVGGAMNIFLIILIGMFADKLPRMKSFEILLFISILIELFYYIYVEFILFDNTPTLVEVILFGEITAVAGIILGMLYTPLAFDYVPRNEMGTFVAGRNITSQILRVITLNGIGVFVSLYSMLFLPPGGDMARITLAEVADQSVIEERLTDPVDGIANGDKLTVSTYYATNASFEEGRAFEIRRKNKEALDLKEQIDELTTDLQVILARKNNAEAAAERAAIAGNPSAREEALERAAQAGEEAAPLEEEIARLAGKQQAFADSFLLEIHNVIGDRLMVDGSQVEAVEAGLVTLFEIPLTGRPEAGNLANTLDQLRLIRPDILDMRLANRGLNFYLELSVVGEHTGPEFTAQLARDFEQVAQPRIESSTEFPAPIGLKSVVPSVALQLKTIEDPLNNYISPITRVLYGIWGWFGDPPSPERRIWAVARVLRQLEGSTHVGVWDRSDGQRHSIWVQAVYANPPSLEIPLNISSEDASLLKIRDALGPGNPRLAEAMDLYQRSVQAAVANRITIPSPVLETRFAPPKYDYMSGYLWMIFMSTLGLGICILFTRREKKGLIHKRGQEESEAEAKAEMKLEAAHPDSRTDGHKMYKPGYLPQKILMTLGGLAMVTFGMVEMGPKLQLLLTGESATAVASKVVKERIGGMATNLTSDAELLEAKERFDRSYIFWNHFQFEDTAGELVEFRLKIGKQLAPAYSIRDEDGLPTTVRIFYNPDNPEEAIIPGDISIWFLSGLFVLFGGIGATFGGILVYHARKPIAMPVILSSDT